MAIDGALVDATTGQGLYVGADHSIIMTVYQADGVTLQVITGWTIVLDIRKRDTSSTVKLTKTGVVTGTSEVTFTLTDEELAAAIFPGDDPEMRYSIKRTDAGSEQPLRFGDVTIMRVTQA